tara:strand:+ start:225 stop:1397 length:1173 start_codon:yes stop_codon:yes gene_type:complete
MFTRNIKFKNFYGKKNISIIKKLSNIFKKEDWIKKYPLLSSLNKNYKYSYNKKEISKFKKFSSFNLIGMGGSILGSEAIYQFLKHKINKKFYFYNNLQNKTFLKSNNKKLNLIISKSGNTLETICNFNLLTKIQKKNKNVIITEKKNNFLSLLAKKLKAEIFEHKNFIGGRYSVLSEAGMLPAELMGLNQEKFKKFNELIKKKSFMNLLIENVSFISAYIVQGKHNSVILNYDEKSTNLFRWYQQLTAESLGKNAKGIFPIISTMPKDNHSLLQLYLDGPKKNFFTFFEVKDKVSNKFNKNNLFNNFNFLKDKSLNEILCSQKTATEIVFKKKKIPFRSFEILNRNEETLGELFCFFILETILLGRLLKVNPFDQPSVELLKTETKKILI